MPPYYKPEKAHLPRQVAYKEYGTSPYHSEKFKTSSLDQLFIDIDESVAKNHIDVALVESLLIKQKIDRSIKADDILKKIYPVFVDLLEQGYNRQDLGC